MKSGHLFFAHADNLRKVNLRYAHGSQLEQFFSRWLQEYPDPYPQRYRKNIPFRWVEKNGTLLMGLADGEVVFPKSVQADLRRHRTASRGRHLPRHRKGRLAGRGETQRKESTVATDSGTSLRHPHNQGLDAGTRQGAVRQFQSLGSAIISRRVHLTKPQN